MCISWWTSPLFPLWTTTTKGPTRTRARRYPPVVVPYDRVVCCCAPLDCAPNPCSHHHHHSDPSSSSCPSLWCEISSPVQNPNLEIAHSQPAQNSQPIKNQPTTCVCVCVSIEKQAAVWFEISYMLEDLNQIYTYVCFTKIHQHTLTPNWNFSYTILKIALVVCCQLCLPHNPEILCASMSRRNNNRHNGKQQQNWSLEKRMEWNVHWLYTYTWKKYRVRVYIQ